MGKVTAIAMGIWAVAVLAASVPCEQQGQPKRATAVVAGDVTQDVALLNRQAIEGAPSITLPIGTVKLDRGFTPVSGQSIDGNGATVVNAFDPGTRTMQARGGGLGYCDPLTVTGANEVTLRDPTQAVYYKPGQPAYFFRIDGFMEAGLLNELRTVHGVVKSDPATGKVTLTGPALDKRLTGGKWFANAYFVGDVKQGATQFIAPTGIFKPGDWMLLTEGPSIANEGRDEWHKIASVSGAAYRLSWPVQRSYNAALYAQAQPVLGVTLKNLTIGGPPTIPTWATQINYAVNWRFDGVTGSLDLAGCAFCTFVNCSFAMGSYFNSTHDCLFLDCRFQDAFGMEECCFNNQFVRCTFLKSFGCNTACERLTFLRCRLTGANSWMGITAPGSLVDSLTCDPLTGGVFLAGDGFVAVNIVSSCLIWPQTGRGFILSNVRAPTVMLGNAGQPSSGNVFDSPNTVLKAGSWTVSP